MVHKKYIKQGKRKYGPYLYETKRVNGRVITTYIGKVNEKKRKFAFYYLFLGLLLVLLLLFLFFPVSFTGYVISDNSEVKDTADLEAIRESKSIEKAKIQNKVVKVVGVIDSTETTQYDAILGKPVKWRKNVKLSSPGIVSIAIPLSAVNISIVKIIRVNKTIAQAGNRNINATSNKPDKITNKSSVIIAKNKSEQDADEHDFTDAQEEVVIGDTDVQEEVLIEEEEIKEKTEEKSEEESESEEFDENIVSELGNLIINNVFVSFFNRFVRFTGLTIIGDEIVVKQDKQIIEINEIVEEVEIEYYTDAPYVVEEAIENGKRVQIIGPEDVHYENVLAFTKLSESLNVRNPSQVKIYWVENNTYISHLNIIDNNKNGIYDYIEWIAPFLSNQTFNIIVITKAEHLDENRTFISDVFKEVRELDGIWSETIPNTHYVRVTFEINLTSDRDITLYPRTVSGTPRIEVYEINGNKLIAEFTSLIDNQYNKVFLTNLQGSQDTFDLLILDGDIEFDHIIDPTAEFFEDCISLSVAPGTWTLTGGATQWFAGGGGGDAGNCNAKNVDFNTNMTSATLNLGGGKTANLSYDWETSGLDSSTNEHFSVWIDNGTTVVELFNQQPDATGTNVHVLQDNITLTSTVTIIGECRNDANNERCRWDNINVTSYPAVDNEFPIFSSFTEVPANNTAYVSGATYRFNATITSTNGTAGIEFDGVNYTANNVTSDVYNVSVTDLAAGSYEYYWWSFGNGSSNNYNASGTRGYTVAKATGDVEVYLDGNTANITVELGSTVTYNASVLTGEITTEVYEDGTLVANGTATTNTTVTNSVGSINITAILVESQNYTSDDQTRFIDVQDTTPPDVNITFPESVIYGNKDIPLNFNVTLNENGSVMYSLDGGINNITMYNGTNIIGRYFNATNNSIADGDYTFTAYANDTAGNQNNTESVTFSFDGTVPLLAIDSPQSITYSVSRIEFNITLSEEGNASWFTLDGGTVNYTMTKYNTTVFNYTNASVPDGTYTAQFYANDSAGNINDTESVTFSVDTTPPTVNFTNPTPANGSTQTNTDIFVNVSSNDSGDHYTFVDFDNDLVLWMRMDDVNSSGDPTDLSSYSNNGTLVGNAKINSSGYFGNASWFDGEGDYINTGVWNLSDKFSVSLWFNRKDLDTSNHVGVFTKHNHFLIRFAQTSGNFQSFIGTGSGFASGNIDAGTLNDDQWYHSVITWDGSTLQLYLNGTFDSSAAVSGSIGGNGNSFQIGLWRDSFNEYFNGSIDEVLVFNRSLSSDEISALYNASTNQYFNNFTGLAADTNHTFTGYAVDIYGNKNQTEERVVMISAVATGKNNWISGSLQPFDNATAWSLGTVPVTGDNVVFNATGTGDVNITNNTMPQDLNSFLVESGYTGTISFQGLFAVGNWTEGNTGTQFWNVTNNITIANGTMKIYGDYPYNITNEGHGQVWNSTSGNITIGSEATLDGVGLGFPVGVGPGTGSSTQSSAHGGRGESYKYYGNFSAPTALGSGGGDAGEGGSGIKLSATSGIILIDGNIFMNGSVGGGRRGSGGSIWLRADNITGTGIVSAVGGRSTGVSRSSGGGGRIRFDFNKYGFTGTIDAESPTPPTASLIIKDAGTFSFSSSLTDSNEHIYPFDWNITHDIALPAAQYNVSGNFIVSSGVVLSVQGDYITDDLAYNTTEEGSGVRIYAAGNITIDNGASIYGDGLGFPPVRGPGYPGSDTGAAHGGGVGGNNNIYGNAIEPTSLGSGGGNSGGSRGGSAVKLESSDRIVIDGNITVIAAGGTSTQGSGGSIWLEAPNISGTSFVLAEGGDIAGGINRAAGAGGRIALTSNGTVTFDGTISVDGGRESEGGSTPNVNHGDGGTIYINVSTSVSVPGNITSIGLDGGTINITDSLLTLSGNFNATFHNATALGLNGTITTNYTDCDSTFTGTFNPARIDEGPGNCDATAPNLTIDFPANITYSKNITELNISAADDTGLDTCLYSTDGGTTNTTMASCPSNVTLNYVQGGNTVDVWVNDTSNNLNHSSVNFSIDSLAPFDARYLSPTPDDGANLSQNYITLNVSVNDSTGGVDTVRFYLYNSTGDLVNNTNVSIGGSLNAYATVNFTSHAGGDSLSDDSYIFNLTVNDTINNVNASVLSRNITLDNEVPGVVIKNPENRNYSSSTLDFNISLDEEGDTALLSLDGGTTNYTMTRYNNTWFNYTNSSIPDGSYTANFYVNDSAGNANNTESIGFGIDTTDPSINLTYPLNTTYISIQTLLNYTVSDTDLDTCWYSTDDGTTNTTVTCGDNVTGLSSGEGSSTWRVYANDSAGNENSSNVTFFVDSVIPLISYGNGVEVDGANVSVSFIFVNVTVTETNEDTITFTLHNSTGEVNITSFTDSTRSINFTGLSDETYTYNVTVNDILGNENTTATRTITLDATFPTIVIDEPQNITYTTTSLEINFTATDDNRDSCRYTDDGGTTNNTLVNCDNTTYTASQGSTTITVYVNDSVNNENSSSVTFFVDSIIPAVDYVSPTETDGNFITRTEILINVTSSDDNLINITIRLYNSTQDQIEINTSTDSPFFINYSSLSDGLYYFNATATDTLNNQNSTGTRNVTIDTAAPNVIGLIPIENSAFNTSASIEIAANVTDDTTSISSVLVNITLPNATINQLTLTNVVDNKYNTSFSIPNLIGRYNLTFIANDTVNNINDSETTFFNATDKTPPEVTINVPESKTYTTSSIDFDVSLNEDGDIVQYTLDNGVNNITMSTVDNREYNATNSSIADGSYTFQVYANDTVGNNNYTENVTFTVDTSTGGDSGGTATTTGGGGRITTVSFSIDRDLMNVKIKQGETKREVIVIENTGSRGQRFNLDIQEIERFVILSEESFTLSSGNSKEINADFFASENEPAEIYGGRIIIRSGSVSKSINVILEIREKSALFDTRSELADITLTKSQKLKVKINITDIGDLNKRVDVVLEYFIKDFEGNEIKLEEETIGVYGSILIDRKFSIPKWLEPGDYLFSVKLTYLDSVATSANRFTIKKESPLITFIRENFVILIIILTLIILVIVHRLGKSRIRYYLSNIYVECLRIKYGLILIRAKYKAGLYDQQILAIKHLPRNILGIIQNYLNKIYALYLQTKYKIKMNKTSENIKKKSKEQKYGEDITFYRSSYK